MKAIRRILSACVLATSVAACGTGLHAPQHYYVLDPGPDSPPKSVLVATTAKGATLLVTPTTAPGFYDAQAIVYSPAIGTRAYYQLNSWTEPPSRRLVALLAERLRQNGDFETVITATGGTRGALVLDTRLDEFYHDAVTRPGSVKISLTATLSDPARRFVAGQRRFTASASAPTPDAVGAVQAFDIALGSLLNELVQWTGETATQSRALP